MYKKTMQANSKYFIAENHGRLNYWKLYNHEYFIAEDHGMGAFSTGAVHKRRQNYFGSSWYPPPPCRNFVPDLANFYLLISCNIDIWDPLPLKCSDVFYGWPQSGGTWLAKRFVFYVVTAQNHFLVNMSDWDTPSWENLFIHYSFFD